jgi:hypothetical protein
MNPYSPPSPYAAPAPTAPGYLEPPAMAPGPAGAVSETAVELLRQTRPWVIFLSVLCFVGSGLCLLAGLFMLVAGAFAGVVSKAGPAEFSPAILGAVYVPLSGLYVYPGVKLWSYGAAIGRLLGSRALADLESALLQQKSFWKYSGIMAIAVVALYVLIVVGAIVIGVAAAVR